MVWDVGSADCCSGRLRGETADDVRCQLQTRCLAPAGTCETISKSCRRPPQRRRVTRRVTHAPFVDRVCDRVYHTRRAHDAACTTVEHYMYICRLRFVTDVATVITVTREPFAAHTHDAVGGGSGSLGAPGFCSCTCSTSSLLLQKDFSRRPEISPLRGRWRDWRAQSTSASSSRSPRVSGHAPRSRCTTTAQAPVQRKQAGCRKDWDICC